MDLCICLNNLTLPEKPLVGDNLLHRGANEPVPLAPAPLHQKGRRPLRSAPFLVSR